MAILSLQIRPVGIRRDLDGDKQKRIGHSGSSGAARLGRHHAGLAGHKAAHQTPSNSVPPFVQVGLRKVETQALK